MNIKKGLLEQMATKTIKTLMLVAVLVATHAVLGVAGDIHADEIPLQSNSFTLSRSHIEWHLLYVTKGTGEPYDAIVKNDRIEGHMLMTGDRLLDTYREILVDQNVDWKQKAVLLNDLSYLPGDYSRLRQPIRECLSSPWVNARYAAIAALAKWGNDNDLDDIGGILISPLTDVQDRFRDAVRGECIRALGEHGKLRHIRVLEEYASREHERDPQDKTWAAEQVKKAIVTIKQRSDVSQKSTLPNPSE